MNGRGVSAGHACMVTTEFRDYIAERMRAEHTALAARWFDRLLPILPVDAAQVFPSASLLDHIPALIAELGDSLRVTEPLAANTAVHEKARELGSLRHGQRASLHQVLREYQVLADTLVEFVREHIPQVSPGPSPLEVSDVVSRLHQASAVLMQATVETFVELYTQTMAEQAERLEQFTRMAAHEWRQPLGTLQFALSMLRTGSAAPSNHKILDSMTRSVGHLIELTHKIETLARLDATGDDPVVQQLSATVVATEAARQLAEAASERGVEIRVDPDLPVLKVDTGRLELALLNLLSNAVKYSDPDKGTRFVEIGGGPASNTHCHLVIRDNGIGIPADRQARIFERFTRAHTDRDRALNVSGLGLGLSIVADCVRSLGGNIALQSREGVGTTFTMTLPANVERPPL